MFESQLRRFLASDGGVPISGAEDAIRQLRAAGIKVVLTSGFDRRLIADVVAHCGWAELFDAIVYPDEVPAGRPAPYLIFQAMQKTLVHPVARVAAIGDTTLDLQAGANAGAGWVIGVLSGAHDLATLGRTPHTHLLSSIAEVPLLFGIDRARKRGAPNNHFVARISSWAKSALRIDIYLRRTYSGRPSFSIRLSDATAMATSVVCRPSVRERSASPITRL